jgi:hypothetical protein
VAHQEEQHWDTRTIAFEALVKPLIEPLAKAAQETNPQQRSGLDARISKALRYLPIHFRTMLAVGGVHHPLESEACTDCRSPVSMCVVYFAHLAER